MNDEVSFHQNSNPPMRFEERKISAEIGNFPMRLKEIAAGGKILDHPLKIRERRLSAEIEGSLSTSEETFHRDWGKGKGCLVPVERSYLFKGKHQ